MRGFVAHFVAVDWADPGGTGLRGPGGGTVPALPGRALVARIAPAGGCPGRAREGACAPPLDEHLAVDADACRDPGRLECADVLQTGRTRPATDALRWLAETRASHPGARLIAAPLPGGGWAAAGDDGDRGGVLLPPGVFPSPGVLVPSGAFLPYGTPYGTPSGRTTPGWSLVPSCLHGWLVAGHTLRELCEPRLNRCQGNGG
ncbi:hypothetical protein ACFXKG_15730 [Streptomyces sp. NPDC059255]|uniref:hypothetical protein n=1 Tax=Streptomyces sp. NPDC059255 TaxID=3346793 RepID=UPI0036803661